MDIERTRVDEHGSAMTRDEFDTVYKTDSMDPQEFIKYSFDDLRKIAEQGTAERKA